MHTDPQPPLLGGHKGTAALNSFTVLGGACPPLTTARQFASRTTVSGCSLYNCKHTRLHISRQPPLQACVHATVPTRTLFGEYTMDKFLSFPTASFSHWRSWQRTLTAGYGRSLTCLWHTAHLSTALAKWRSRGFAASYRPLPSNGG